LLQRSTTSFVEETAETWETPGSVGDLWASLNLGFPEYEDVTRSCVLRFVVFMTMAIWTVVAW
jgi:hypothetical protein